MQRNELKTIAEGFKKSRPPMVELNTEYLADLAQTRMLQWCDDVRSIAAALKLGENPKALSNFYAACGYDKGHG